MRRADQFLRIRAGPLLELRLEKEYGVSDRTPLSVLMVPLPDLRSPVQTALAERFMEISFFGVPQV